MRNRKLRITNIILLIVLVIAISGCSGEKNAEVLKGKEPNEAVEDPQGKGNDLVEISSEKDIEINNFLIDDQIIKFSIVNNTKEEVFYNEAFKLFEKGNNEELLPKGGFKDIANRLKPGEEVSFEINLKEQFNSLELGEYILEKKISKENNEYYNVKKEFKLK